MWTRSRIIAEVRRLTLRMGFSRAQDTVDYIMLRPYLVSKEFYKKLSTGDFPEIRKGYL